MTNTRKILVTGAGGTVGSHVVKALAELPVSVRLGFHSQDKLARARAQGLDAVALDFADSASLRRALDGAGGVFLLGTGLRGQVEAETNLVNEAKRAGVSQLVKLSVWDAELEGYEIARVHRAVERVIESSGLAFTFLRANGFMQNFVNHMAGSIRDGAFHQPAGTAAISHVDVRDIAAVAARALTQPEHAGRARAYDLSGPEALSYARAAELLAAQAGHPVKYVALSDADARSGMVARGMPEFYADALVDLNRYYRTGAGSRVSNHVAEALGRPALSFEQFVTDHRSAF